VGCVARVVRFRSAASADRRDGHSQSIRTCFGMPVGSSWPMMVESPAALLGPQEHSAHGPLHRDGAQPGSRSLGGTDVRDGGPQALSRAAFLGADRRLGFHHQPVRSFALGRKHLRLSWPVAARLREPRGRPGGLTHCAVQRGVFRAPAIVRYFRHTYRPNRFRDRTALRNQHQPAAAW
jgi:hypothetical protein